MSLSAALSAEVRVEVVEHGGPTLEPGLVIPVAHGDARFRTFQGCELPQGPQTSVLGLSSSSCLSCPDVVPYFCPSRRSAVTAVVVVSRFRVKYVSCCLSAHKREDLPVALLEHADVGERA